MSSAEEFSSNESGWTKYLGSPSQEEGNYSSGVYDDECNFYQRNDLASHRGGGGKHNNSDDNDSVASDASSGPSHHEAFIARNMNRGGGSSNFSAVDEEEGFYYGRTQPVGERACKDAKGKAAKEPVVDHKGKKGISLKQKRGKKAN